MKPELKPDLLDQLRITPEQRYGRRRGVRRWLPAGVVAVLLLAGAAAAVLHGGATPVQTAAAQPLQAAAGDRVVLDATGYVTARREATVSSKVTGRLAEVLIEEGDRVKGGQVLARLDGSDQQARLALAQTQLAAARAQLGSLQAQLDQAHRDLRRQQQLSAKHLTTAQAVDDARTHVDVLSAQLAAQQRQVDVAQAEVRIAQLDYDNTVIRAPFDGVVIAKAAQPGEIVSPISAGGGFTRTGIGTIVDMDSLEVEVDVNEAYINRVQPHQKVVTVLDAYPDWKIPGEVIAIIPAADRSKATVKVRIALGSKDPRIVPDMGARVSFFEDPSDNAGGDAPAGVLVPATAIVDRDGHSVLFVVRDRHAQRREVSPGQVYGDMRLIPQGVQAGEPVVREPPPQLRDGQRVRETAAGQGQ